MTTGPRPVRLRDWVWALFHLRSCLRFRRACLAPFPASTPVE